MEITKSNYKSKFPEIKEAILNASFLAIDCEFSGLNIDQEANISIYDSYDQYYSKLRRSVNKFLVLQFGLCAFRYDESDQNFKQTCYNFYLFPRPANRSLPDQRFVCQASSIDFLARNDLDFNKVFKEGITYLNSSDEARLRETIEERHRNKLKTTESCSNSSILIPNEEKPFINEVMTMIENYLKSDEDELMLPQCNSFRRRIIYESTREKYGKQILLETRVSSNKDRVLFVKKPDTLEMATEKSKQQLEASLDELEDAVGFSRVIQCISESGKIIVGHNLCLDLLHLIDKFMVPLPGDYEEFKSCANCLFPKIIDTKTMASSEAFKDLIDNTVLSKLVNFFNQKPFTIPKIVIDENSQGYELNDQKEHEAGYDAFITGVCFIAMMRHLDDSEQYYKSDSKIIKYFFNKIFVLKLQDCQYLNLSGKDPKISREHVVHITFPKEWKTNDLTQLFSPFGNIHICWLNDTSAYVALQKKDQTTIALSTLSQSDKFQVMSYAQHQNLFNSGTTALGNDHKTTKKRNLDISNSSETRKRRKDTNFGDYLKSYCRKTRNRILILEK